MIPLFDLRANALRVCRENRFPLCANAALRVRIMLRCSAANEMTSATPLAAALILHDFNGYHFVLSTALILLHRKAYGGCVADGFDVSKTMNPRDGSGPRSPVDGRVKAELGEIEPRRPQSQGHVDGRPALVDRRAHVCAGRNAGAYPGNPARGQTLVADKVELRAGLG